MIIIWKQDVLLIADVFEKFTSKLLKFYKLDPCHSFSSPGLIWVAMLEMNGIKLELILDIDEHLFIEKGLRGGISFMCKIFSEANNKDIKNYDPTKENKFIMYLDEKILFDWGMSQYLPYRKFKWLKST